MKPIVTTPNPVLSAPARTVTLFDKRLGKLIRDMKAILQAATNPKGVGLAAPQIGEPWRVFITKPLDDIRVFINPEIIRFSTKKTDGVPERENKLEGCLSIPKIWGRHRRTLKYQDESENSYGKFSGFATIIQHDHTNGFMSSAC
jgi:peptide deformylase